MVKYVKPAFIQKHYQISGQTLRKWADTGKVNTIKMPDSRNRLYDYDHFVKYVGGDKHTDIPKTRKTVCYARVSSNHQKQDLERQILFLKEKYPEATIYKDISSGLNWNRKNLQKMVEQIIEGDIEKVVVAHSDRLSRFGFEMLRWIFKKFDCTIMVLNENTSSNPEVELSQDVLSIINYFTAKNNGIRASQNRKNRADKIEKNKTASNN